MNVVGYVRVSTDDQAASGLGLAAQRATITDEATRRGWSLVGVEQDVQSGRTRRKRAGLDAAIARCLNGDAEAVVTAKLDRLSRSVIDFAQLVEDSHRRGYSIIVLDPAIDLTTPNGRLVAGVLSQVAQWEREIISDRISDAFRAKRADGDPAQISLSARARILALRNEGHSERSIAAALTREGFPPLGAGWHRTTITRVLRQERARR